MAIVLSALFATGAMFGWLAVALAFTLGLLWWTLHRRWIWPGIFLLSSMFGWIRLETAPVPTPSSNESGVSWVTGSVIGPAFTTARGQSFRLLMTDGRQGDQAMRAGGTICAYAPEQPRVTWGDRIELFGRFERIEDVPIGFGKSLLARSCEGRVSGWQVKRLAASSGPISRLDQLRQRMADTVSRSAVGDQGALLTGLVTGDDGGLSDEAHESFIRTGTTHITAVSGSNFALIVVIAAAVGTAGGVSRRFAWLLVTVGAIWLYAIMVGLGPPSLRAALVATLAAGAVLAGRKADFLTLAMVALAIQLAIRPLDRITLSFQLSVLSSLALILVLSTYDPEQKRPFWQSAILATGAAQLATLAVLAAAIGEVSIVSLPANLMIAPLASLAFPLAAAGSIVGMLFQPLGAAILAPASLAAAGMIVIVSRLASFDWSVLHLGVAIGELSFWLITILAALYLAALSSDVRAQGSAWKADAGLIAPSRHLALFAMLIGLLIGIALESLLN
jgi:ComEC/Rec2-related protein